jgi:hypothetical protein
MTMLTASRRNSRFLSLICLAGLLLAGMPSLASAESQTIGDYTVHYQAVNSTFLTPEIAGQYGITRSERRAFLNIAVLRNHTDGTTTPVAATVTGGKQNLMQQAGNIDFEEIREGESIYYIGQFDFSNAETLRFAIDVQPEAKGTTHRIEWTTQLYSQ